MASTTFIDKQTVIEASWLNDVNASVYTGTQPATNAKSSVSVDLITNVNTTAFADGVIVIARGRSSIGDGGGGVFRYSSTSTQAVDGGLVFAPSAGNGRLFRDGWTVLGFVGSRQARWWGVVADGTTDDTVALQSAFNAIPAGGADLALPDGPVKLSGTGVTLLNKSNVTVYGAGRGLTLIDGSLVTGGTPNSVIQFGNVSGPATLNNITFRDFSIKGSGTSTTGNIFNFRGTNNVVFERLEVYNGYNEVLYCDGPSVSFDGLAVVGCYFHNSLGQLSACINTNTLGVSNIVISGNVFERVSTGIHVLGENVCIIGNTFKDVSNNGIAVAESNLTANRSLSSCVISGNTFTGQGRSGVALGGYAFTNSAGILVKTKAYAYTDNTADNGVIVANNTFKDSYADVTLDLIDVWGGTLINGNYASGLLSTTSTASFITVRFSSDSGSAVGVNGTSVSVYVRNNVLEKKPAGSNIHNGLRVRSVDKSFLYCSGNNFDAATAGAAFFETSNGFLPYVSVNGDKFSSCALYNLAGSSVPASEALFGSNTTTFNTATSPDLLTTVTGRNLGGSTTPDVSKGVWFYCSNGSAVSITDFINNNPATKEITIWFNDANTTVVHNASFIRLNGSVNFVSSAGASLTLCRPNHINDVWYEKCRSKP